MASSQAMLTRCVDLIREISHVVGTPPIYAPEGTAVHPISKPREVDMARRLARLEGAPKRFIVDMVAITPADLDGQVVVAVY